MKFTLAILTVLAPFFVHAGGGGGLRPGMESGMVRPEIVYQVREADGMIEFAHGSLENHQWNIQNLKIPTVQLIEDRAVFSALKKSKVLNNWVEIQ